MRGPSEAARCASTGALQVAFPLILLSFLHLDLKGSCQTILHCAQLFHPPNPERTKTRSSPRRAPLQLCSFHTSHRLSQEGGLLAFPLRASNEGLLRPRVARAKEANGLPSHSSLDRCTLPLAIIHRPIHLEIENVLSPATIIQRSRRMKLLIGTVATVSGVLFALSMASANPSLLPKHEGYP